MIRWLLMSLLICRGIGGIQVLEFQKDGVASLWSVAEYAGPLDRSWKLESLTLCARFQIFYMHDRGTIFQLQDTPQQLEAQLKGELWLDRVRPVIAHRWKFQLIKEQLSVYRWYHLCFTYDHQRHTYNTFVDGHLNYQTLYNVGRPVYGDYVRLGQGEQLKHSFSGALSQVNLWDHPLSAETIAEMAACRIDPKGNYVSWDEEWILSNVTQYTVRLKQFCEKEEKTTQLWFPLTSWASASYICEALGSRLPLPTTKVEAMYWYNISERTWPNEPSLCRDNFWASIEDILQEGVWVTHYDQNVAPNPAWKDGEPNGNIFENCAHIDPDGLVDIDCSTNKRCSVCEFANIHTYTLLGICEAELRNVHFTVDQKHMSHFMFQGYGDYRILMIGDEWVWLNTDTNQTLARLDSDAPLGMPMGRRTWHLEAPVCGQVSGTRTLTLSPCSDDSYTCDDATCIPREYRCDYKNDCQDQSDEADCDIVKKSASYRKDIPPREHLKANATVLVAINITIEAVDIETAHMTMLASYTMNMVWLDNRLTYRNLKLNDSLNTVSVNSMMSLWIPFIGFINTGSSQHSKVDKEASLYIKRLEPSAYMDSSAPGEVEMFLGDGNPLSFTRVYFTTFICDFNLVLYPFDKQHCDMHLRILSASKEYVNVNQQASFARYTGSELLLEYQLMGVSIHFDKSGEFSDMRIRLSLKRRTGYALTDIYIPSLILLLISYISLFFRTHIFEVRIMTTLTSLLVMATLFSQVSASLPKTSYFKMVDVWLLFCIVMSFLIIIFHTIIDISLGEIVPRLPHGSGSDKGRALGLSSAPYPNLGQEGLD